MQLDDEAVPQVNFLATLLTSSSVTYHHWMQAERGVAEKRKGRGGRRGRDLKYARLEETLHNGS